MSIRTKFSVKSVTRNEIKDFIESYHYSHNINGVISDYCFGLYDQANLIGAMIYGRPAMAGQWKKYTDKPEELTELRRLVCVDITPKNTESYFIGKTLRWLKKNTELKIVISYADLEHGHSGVIYKASNFEFKGTIKGDRVILVGDKQYHSKTIRTTYKGSLKPYAKKIKDQLASGEAIYKQTKGKNVYLYKLA